jgi:hypothetical protein
VIRKVAVKRNQYYEPLCINSFQDLFQDSLQEGSKFLVHQNKNAQLQMIEYTMLLYQTVAVAVAVRWVSRVSESPVPFNSAREFGPGYA